MNVVMMRLLGICFDGMINFVINKGQIKIIKRCFKF